MMPGRIRFRVFHQGSFCQGEFSCNGGDGSFAASVDNWAESLSSVIPYCVDFWVEFEEFGGELYVEGIERFGAACGEDFL
jgi:hypothetical protein